MSDLSALGKLSDQELLARVRAAAQTERHATAQLIALLMELDSRRLYLGEGFSSLFTYCTHVLHLSEHAAYIVSKRRVPPRRFPIILDLISGGDVTLTSVRLLAPHLTLENHRDVLAVARHKSKRDIEAARRRPPSAAGCAASCAKAPDPYRSQGAGGEHWQNR